MASTEDITTRILSHLTDIFSSFSISLSISSPLSITLLSRTSATYRPRTIQFPGRTVTEARIFTCTLRILSIIRSLLTSSQTATKRDIYYRNVTLFRSQVVVDRLVDDIAATFGVRRRDLGIMAAAKGLVRGAVKAVLKDGTVLDAMTGGSGALIPHGSQIERLEVGPEVKWVVVVEKEAVFRTLCELGSREYIFITGKGYPDVSTREFVVWLAQFVGENVPVFGLVDMDPHGIEIMITYRFGSVGMTHEESHLVCRRLRWLGVKMKDLDEVIHRRQVAVVGENERDVRERQEGLVSLTERGRKKALHMLKKSYVKDEPECRAELQRILFLGLKAEIEVLGTDIQNWLDERITQDFHMDEGN